MRANLPTTGIAVIFMLYFALLVVYWKRSEPFKEPEEDKERNMSHICSLAKDDCPRLLNPPIGDGFLVVPKYNIATCPIANTISSLLSRIMCYLYDSAAYAAANATTPTPNFALDKRLCSGKNEYLRNDFISSFPTAKIFLIVREPISRFIHGFAEQCLREGNDCHGCQKNMSCFIDVQYDRLMAWSRPPYQPMDDNYVDSIFSPQHWRCGLPLSLYKVKIFKYDDSLSSNSNLIRDLEDYLSQQGVIMWERVFVVEEMFKARTSNEPTEESNSASQELYNDPDLLLKVVKMYYYDFILFGFPIPQV